MIKPTLFDEFLCVTGLFPKSISISAMQMRFDYVEVDRRNCSKDISEIRFSATMGLGGDEHFSIRCSCGRRPSPT